MRRLFLRFARCERGATAVEYALVASILGIGIGYVAFSMPDSVWNNLVRLDAIAG